MPRKNRETTPEERQIILNLRKEGKSYTEIGRALQRSRYTIRTIIKNFEQHKENLYDKYRSGRPRKLNDRQERTVLREIKKNPQTTAPELCALIHEKFNIHVHEDTVRNVIKRAGYYSRVARRKPLISKKNKKLRVEFANKFISKDNDYWSTVIFSDESKFNIFKCDGRIRIWRKPNTEFEGQNVQPTVKHGGGGVMVWGCMAAAGVGELVFIDSIMDKMVYMNILQNNLSKSVEKLRLGNNWTFQQDNDPKHTAHIVRQWIIYHTPHTLPTPPQSPDLNPIEHLWSELEKRVRKHHITSKEHLKTLLLAEWNNIEPEITQKLVYSMKNRLIEVLRRKGGNTKY